MKNSGKRRIILLIVLILFLAVITVLGYRTVTYEMRIAKERAELAQQQAEQRQKEAEKNNFNAQFKSPFGRFSASTLNQAIDKLINSNKTNPDHFVELIYNGESCGMDDIKIQKVKEQLDNFKDYDVSFNYDSNGYIYEFMIVEQRETPDAFNHTFEHFAGSQDGFFLETLLTNVITNNTKYPEYAIEVVFNKKSYGTNPDEIRKAKNQLQTFTKYEVSFEYDANHYIIKVSVVKK